ncbi:MAG: hypothetical protein V1899_07160 [Planctomycetota bacterium]
MSTVITEVSPVETIHTTHIFPDTAVGKALDTVVARIQRKRIFKAAEDSAEFFDHLRAHYRETRRTDMDVICDVRFVLADGTIFDRGSGVLRNISPSGALIDSLKLEKGTMPVQAFKVMIALKSGEYADIGIEATPVRLAPEVAGLGVKFEEIFVTV